MLKRLLFSCVADNSADQQAAALSELRGTYERTKAEAEQVNLELNADIRRLQTSNATREPKERQVSLLRKIKATQGRLARLRAMEANAQKTLNDSQDVTIVAENAEAQKKAAIAQRSILRGKNIDVDEIENVMAQLEEDRDSLVDAACALGGSSIDGSGGVLDEVDVTGFLTSLDCTSASMLELPVQGEGDAAVPSLPDPFHPGDAHLEAKEEVDLVPVQQRAPFRI